MRNTTSTRAFEQRLKALARVNEQRAWIQQHGGTMAGYIARYGSASEPQHYGDGGEAIYMADMERLHRLVAEARA